MVGLIAEASVIQIGLAAEQRSSAVEQIIFVRAHRWEMIAEGGIDKGMAGRTGTAAPAQRQQFVHLEFRLPCSDAANPFPQAAIRIIGNERRDRSREVGPGESPAAFLSCIQPSGTGRLQPNVPLGVGQAAERLHIGAVRTVPQVGAAHVVQGGIPNVSQAIIFR